MPASFRHAALIGPHDAAGMRELLQAIAELMTRRGVEVSFESETTRRTGVLEQPVVEPDEIGHRCVLAIVVGGDGPMLRLAPGWSYYATLCAKLHWYSGSHVENEEAEEREPC